MLGIMLSVNVRLSDIWVDPTIPTRLIDFVVKAPPTHSLSVFTSVVVIVSLGSLVVTIQAKLLGGRVYVLPLT